MPYLTKVVLHCTSDVAKGLDILVERFLADGVKFVGVVGKDAALIEDIIDEHVVGYGTDLTRFILTSSHPGETLQEAVNFARNLTGEYEGDVEVVEI